jgi:acyl-CoA synthetase (AMP-forming)/AMP-acid ligase II
MHSAKAFVQARDFLLRHREDYDLAYREFRWPQLTEFNTASDRRRAPASNLAPYKRIGRLEFFELPKTISGKIRRVDLRKLEEQRAGDARRPMELWEEDLPELK